MIRRKTALQMVQRHVRERDTPETPLCGLEASRRVGLRFVFRYLGE